MNVPHVIVPDRYEGLERRASSDLGSIVLPVQEALNQIDGIFGRMQIAGRGAFLILEGVSGIGKSTFLHTLRFFRDRARTISVPGGATIRDFLQAHRPSDDVIEVFVLEEREAARSFTDRELEDWLHAINGFIRSLRGEKALVVWPTNTEELRDRVVELARRIGATALLGVSDSPAYQFPGPSREQFVDIAQRTLAVLNQGASLSDLGLTSEIVLAKAERSDTVGAFLTHLHDLIFAQEGFVRELVKREQCRLWVIVAAGNNPQGEVAGLTRGRFSEIDIDRLLACTGANIVAELRKEPEKLGLLGTVLNARILHLPVLAAAALMRAFADEPLRARMKAQGFATTPSDEASTLERLRATELASIFKAGEQGTLSRGPKVGSSSVDAFSKLVEIASTHDALLNRALGNGLVAAGLIDSFSLEQDFGEGLTRRTDIVADAQPFPLRLEVMWRKKAGRADIANYTLIKLANYGRAIGYLK